MNPAYLVGIHTFLSELNSIRNVDLKDVVNHYHMLEFFML
ncbi:hypothetical protein (plasmid) [Metabacillus dongyingensis]|nr:hypothetical protein [Metabacillus dongyingensis]